MARLTLAYQNEFDAASLSVTAGGEAGELNISNLQDPVVARRWRTTDNTAIVTADFGANVSVQLVLLRFPRDTTLMDVGDGVRHWLDADGGTPGTGAVYDSGLIATGIRPGYGYHLHVLPSAVNARYWAWRYTTALDVIDTGRAWIGPMRQLDRNMAFGWTDHWGDLSQVSANARTGAEFVDDRDRIRRLAFQLGDMSVDDRTFVRELTRVTGIARQIVAVTDHEDLDVGRAVILGRREQTEPIAHVRPFRYANAFTIRESL